jgi:hypothetical protein
LFLQVPFKTHLKRLYALRPVLRRNNTGRAEYDRTAGAYREKQKENRQDLDGSCRHCFVM